VKQVVSTYDPDTQEITGVSVTAYFMGGLYEVTDGAVRKYYAMAGMTVAVNDGNGMKYLLTDHLGSVVAVTNESGGLLSEQRYMPFGEVRAEVGNITQTDLGYTGQRALPDLGLMDYHARMYDAVIGRFVQADSIIPNVADPQSWNRFAYVYNSPIDLTDPIGNFGKCRDGQSGYSCKITQNKVRALEKKWDEEAAAKNAAEAAKREDFCANNPVACGRSIAENGGAATTEGNQAFSGFDIGGDQWWLEEESFTAKTLRGPDYITLNVATGWPFGLAGVDLQLSRDYYNDWYVSVGASGGSPGITIFGGWLLQDQRPGPSLVRDFLNAHTVFAGGGAVIGFGGSWGRPFRPVFQMSDVGAEGGFAFPPGGDVGWVYGFPIYKNSAAEP
jgi:RHS repeat-associated protein